MAIFERELSDAGFVEVAGGIERCFEKTTWTASLRRIGWDFRPALLASSAYRRHLGSRSRAPLLYYAKFDQKLRRTTVLIECSLSFLSA